MSGEEFYAKLADFWHKRYQETWAELKEAQAIIDQPKDAAPLSWTRELYWSREVSVLQQRLAKGRNFYRALLRKYNELKGSLELNQKHYALLRDERAKLAFENRKLKQENAAMARRLATVAAHLADVTLDERAR